MNVGRGGKPVKRYQREYYYECEGVKLSQTKLSFKKMTASEVSNIDATTTFFSTSKVGQNDCTDTE